MPYINADEREIAFKLVYYGPGMSGKTTNLLHLHRVLADERKGELITLDTEQERTLFFDFLPLELGRIDGYSVRFNVYTIPGQSYYEASRRLILDGADGVAFVIDSRPECRSDNLASYRGLEENLVSYAIEPESFPRVLQYNKRDCPHPLPVGILEQELGLGSVPTVEAVATRGIGVMETIRDLSREVVQRFQV